MMDRQGSAQRQALFPINTHANAEDFSILPITRVESRSQERKRDDLGVGKIDTQYQQVAYSSLSASSPHYTPSPDADPECVEVIMRHSQPLSNYPLLKDYLVKMAFDFPQDEHQLGFSKARAKQAQGFIVFIGTLGIYELKYLSLYMHSVQAENSNDIYFKTIRKECGFFGFFQTHGNTKTWQRVRSAVKDALDNQLTRSEIPGKKTITGQSYADYLQIFQQHSGRYKFFDSNCIKTRSEKRFVHHFEPQDVLPPTVTPLEYNKRKLT